MAPVIMVLGYIIMILGSILFLIAAFSESIFWGIGCLFVPFVGLFFLLSHWEEAKTPFFIQLAGAGLIVIGILIGS